MSENKKIPITRKELEKQIIKKALSNKDFKKALVNDPKETFAKLGVQVPEDVEIKVIEESSKVVYLVLPVDPTKDEIRTYIAGCGGSRIYECQLLDHCPGWGCFASWPPCYDYGYGCKHTFHSQE